jgi:hypothetical protein
MVNLLQSKDFLAVVNNHRRDQQRTPLLPQLPPLYTEDCSDKAFDIVDIKQGGKIIQPQGTGTAHYFNSDQVPVRNMRFIAYEQFINNLGQDYNHKWDRVDLIAYDTTTAQSYLIIHELSEGKLQNKRHKALIQLQNTLKRLLETTGMPQYFSGFKNKWCVLSATEGAQPAPLDMTAGFNNIYNALPDPEPLQAASINRLGFEGWITVNVKL